MVIAFRGREGIQPIITFLHQVGDEDAHTPPLESIFDTPTNSSTIIEFDGEWHLQIRCKMPVRFVQFDEWILPSFGPFDLHNSGGAVGE